MMDYLLPLYVLVVTFIAGIGFAAGGDAWQAAKAEWRRFRGGAG